MKDNWIQSDIKFENIEIGLEYLNHESKQLSIVTKKTNNSIELFNTANRKNFYKTGQINEDGEVETKVRLKGVDSLQWYNLDGFNRTFQEVDLTEHKIRIAKEWIRECIGKQKWSKLVF